MAFTSVCHISLARARSSRDHNEVLQDFFVFLEKEEIIKTIAKKIVHPSIHQCIIIYNQKKNSVAHLLTVEATNI